MDYIINPWWFYLISVVSKIDGVATLLGILSFFFTVVFFIVKYDTILGREHSTDDFGGSYTNKPEEIKSDKFVFKILIFILVTSSVVAIATPSTDAMNKMLIANTLTKQNISAGADFTQDQISKIIDKIADTAVKVKESK